MSTKVKKILYFLFDLRFCNPIFKKYKIHKMRKTLFALVAFTFTATTYGQVVLKSEKGKEGMLPSFVEFEKGREPAYRRGSLVVAAQKTIKTLDASLLLNVEKDLKGTEHVRYQQAYNNIPVEGAIYIVHVRQGKVRSENGKWIETFPAQLATTPAITKEAALKAAMADFGAQIYKWQLPEEEQFIKNETNNPFATFFPKAETVYYSGEEEIIPTRLRLAYKLDLYAAEPIGRRIYFVDAVNGKVLGKRDLIHNTNATGTAITAYSGSQPITSDFYSGSYRLRETGRGNGIQTYNLKQGTNYNRAVDFTDADNIWNNVNASKDEYATDAHWGAEKTYDYYKLVHGRNSIDGNGFAIKSYVHYSRNYFNAFWDGTRMTYGDGDASDSYKPLTALDVCGHEITHGLTSFTANLNYSNESGAMNEGFSDIFGTVIEFYARPASADWLIGKDFLTIRSMSNPNDYQQPDTYKGTYWYSGTSDNGGVHTNSGVLNYWFYLLSQGGRGTNDKGFAFAVTGVGIDKAAEIAYKTLTAYLVSSSQYGDARRLSIQAAKDLYGYPSVEVSETANAWDAVGVAETAPPPPCTDTYESNETISAAKPIPTNTDVTALISSTTDKDWFSFTTAAGATNISISLSNLPADYDIRLYNSAGTQIAISQNGGTTSESIKYNTTTTGTYYIQVYGYNGANSTSCYLLRVNTSGTAFFGNTDNPAITSVKDANELKGKLQVYPNPVRDFLTINFASETPTTKHLTVFDIAGRVALRQVISAQKGNNSVRIALPKLARGSYFIRLDDNSVSKFQIAE